MVNWGSMNTLYILSYLRFVRSPAGIVNFKFLSFVSFLDNSVVRPGFLRGSVYNCYQYLKLLLGCIYELFLLFILRMDNIGTKNELLRVTRDGSVRGFLKSACVTLSNMFADASIRSQLVGKPDNYSTSTPSTRTHQSRTENYLSFEDSDSSPFIVRNDMVTPTPLPLNLLRQV
ncbi:hypothetical protein EDC96DRAFT_550053 [Choanephora cucurbitarum]|nr:hypothetical protein EDC96DRAFT_550053 [Choanephora cucurbitarum]